MYNNNIDGKSKIGGARPITNGTEFVLLTGGFNLALKDVPLASEGKITAGTPIQVDEVTRLAKIFKQARVTKAVSAGTDVEVAKMTDAVWGSNPLKVGDIVMVMGAAGDTKGTGVTIDAIDTSDADMDKITVSAAITAAKDGYLVLAAAAGATQSPAVLPNAIMPYDLVKDPSATQITIEACFAITNGQVYNNRIPEIPLPVRVYLTSQNCFFRWSNSK